MNGHDIIVIGASAGGVEALSVIAAGLPADLPAAVLVVIHCSPSAPGRMPMLLSRAGPLPASHAEDGEQLLPGAFTWRRQGATFSCARGTCTCRAAPGRTTRGLR